MRLAPLLPLLLAAAPAAQGILRVDSSASGTSDGSSWTDAFVQLQDALAAALPGDEVWVAAGTYCPDLGAAVTPGDRDAAFHLADGVAVYGGFAGFETSLAQRARLFSQTVLSGDLLGDDFLAAKTDNSLHVVRGLGVDAGARLDGFVVSGGYADLAATWGAGIDLQGSFATLANLCVEQNEASGRGGGLYSVNGAPIWIDCVFRGNAARRSAQGGFVLGGAAFLGGGAPVFERCHFVDNIGEILDTGGGVQGGGLHLTSSAARFVDCTFDGNRAEVLTGEGAAAGGAMYLEGPGLTTFVRCQFTGNAARAQGLARGGTLALQGATPRLDACLLVGGRAEGGIGYGGQLFLDGPSAPLLAQCALVGGFATTDGGALFDSSANVAPVLLHCTVVSAAVGSPSGSSAGLSFSGGSAPVITGCVLWDNGAGTETDQLFSGVPVVDHSCVQGWTGALSGVGSHGLDPLLTDLLGPDGIAGTGDEDLSLAVGSPCRDAAEAAALPADEADLDGDGDVTELLPLDLLGAPRLVDDSLSIDVGPGAGPHPDAGALEAQPGALTSDVGGVSLSAGGTQNLTYTPGPPLAGLPYLVLGTVAGTTPALVVDGVVIPLNPNDPYFAFTVANVNTPLLSGSFGLFDSQGSGACTLTVPAGSNPAFAGIVAHHAFVVFQLAPALAVFLASDPAPVELLP